MTPITPKKRRRKVASETQPNSDGLVISLIGQIVHAQQTLAANDASDERVDSLAAVAMQMMSNDKALVARLLVEVTEGKANQRQPNPFLKQLIEQRSKPQKQTPEQSPEFAALAKQLLQQMKGPPSGHGSATTEIDNTTRTATAASPGPA